MNRREVSLKSGVLGLLPIMAVLMAPTAVTAAEPAHSAGMENFLKGLRYEAIKLNMEERHPLVRGELPGGKNCVFLVDTGWHMTTLNPNAAAGLKTLGERGVALQDSFLGTLTNSSLVLMDKLELGRAQFMNQPARVEKVEMDYIRVIFDGALGCDFPPRNWCLIDCGAWELYLHGTKPSEEQSKLLKETLTRSGFVEIPLSARKPFTFEARINEHPVELLVDTGAAFDALDESLLATLGLDTVKDVHTGSWIPSDVNGYLSGVNKVGTHKITVTTVNSLELGPVQMKNVHFAVTNLKAWGFAKTGTAWGEVKGMMGEDLLHSRAALIDCGEHVLWLRR